MTTHELKLDTKYFDDVKSGKKNFEIRKNDRDFKIGDILKLRTYSRELGKYVRHSNVEYWDYWQDCHKEHAEMITAKIVYVLSSEYWNETNNHKEFMFDTPEEGNLIVNTIKEFCGTDELPDDYVVLGIEVINS